MPAPEVVLGSSSPRRQELLKRLIPRFRIGISQVEEKGSSMVPDWEIHTLDLPLEYAIPAESHPALWAWRKAVDVADTIGTAGNSIVLAADTVVIGEGSLLGKPGTPEAAGEMLSKLRGRKHYVATGCVLLRPGSENRAPAWSCAVVSAVWMRDYSDLELWGYVATGEPLDKAGAYAVQGLGGRLVSRVEGCYYNVVGLPLCEVREGLREVGCELEPYPPGGYCDFCPLQA